jgi:hypothetical protein
MYFRNGIITTHLKVTYGRISRFLSSIAMPRYGSLMYKPEAPFGLEPFGFELKVERLKAERKHRGVIC